MLRESAAFVFPRAVFSSTRLLARQEVTEESAFDPSFTGRHV